ncbi:MAG: MarR family transcriptional regulator [Dehalococcoidia bacterium]|nr:MarR family transcriptional regulator [Dehalococcoidia bacterium]
MRLSPDADFIPTPMQLRVLHAVKAVGEADIPALAARLYLTETGVRQHVGVLESAGLVLSRSASNNRPGRNRRVYTTTPDADAYFPDNSGSQLAALVGYLRHVHPDVLDGWLSEWMNYRSGRVQAADPESTVEQRVAQVVDNATRRGAIMSLESLDEEAIVVRIHHCPMLTLAKATPRVCEIERLAVQRFELGSEAKLEAWKLDGSPYCQFRVVRAPAG